MQYTTNTHMKKPGYSDIADIKDINDNFDVIDEHIGAKVSSGTGTHGIRFNVQDEKLQVYDETYDAWVDTTGDLAGVPPLPVLNDNSWELIHSVSAEGANYWSVGDCKSVLVNGTIGTLSINQTFWAFILGFNHNEAIEGKGIHFGCFKTAQTGGVDVCLVDSNYGNNTSFDGTKYFQMNHWGGSSSSQSVSYGSWAACDMRYDILGSTDKAPIPYGGMKTEGATGQDPSNTCATNPVPNTLMAALPADLRAVMQPIVKYTLKDGNLITTIDETCFIKTIDYLPLLDTQEVSTFGNTFIGYIERYEYYTAGNRGWKYPHTELDNNEGEYWLRDPSTHKTYPNRYFNTVSHSGNSVFYGDGRLVTKSIGIAPVFKV